MHESDEARTHVLITGGAGYIGSVLTERLLRAGCRVTVLDRLFFGDRLSDLRALGNLRVIRDDIRWCDERIFVGVDAVCDLAALSNDPSGELDPSLTLEINHRGRARVCALARENGVGRYVLASSCSVYGFQDGLLTESSPRQPLTTYAYANALAEDAALALAGPEFTVTVLRQATVYGVSRRMRFDLALNGMVLSLLTDGRVRVMRDGTQWRPIVHIHDTCAAFTAVLGAPRAAVAAQIFNVGSDAQNLQVAALAERVCAAAAYPFAPDWYGDPDRRSYRVAFGKIREHLSYSTSRSPEDGVREVLAALTDGLVRNEPAAHTVQWYRERIDELRSHAASATA